MAALALSLLLFAVLWAVPVLVPARFPGLAPSTRFGRGVVFVYGCAFIAAAWWWRAPLSEQQTLRRTAAMTEPDAGVIGCSKVTAAADQFERASDGQLRFARDGSVLLKGSLWNSMNAQQRDAFNVFASKVAECRGAMSNGLFVRDVDTGAQLYPEGG
jgi:hypothetical protein